MGVLERLELVSCTNLAADWLPESSKLLVRTLNVSFCRTLESVPDGMLSLECIDVSDCAQPAVDWLPESCRATVPVLKARCHNGLRIPPVLLPTY